MQFTRNPPKRAAAIALAALLAATLCGCQRPQAEVAVDRLTLVNPWNAFPQGTPAGLVNIADAVQCDNLKLKNDAMQAQGGRSPADSYLSGGVTIWQDILEQFADSAVARARSSS